MPEIAGPEVGRPTTIDEVTPEWLTAVLRTSGEIAAPTTVGAAEIVPFAEGLGFLSSLHQARLTYEGDAEGAPETVIVKMPTDLELQRGMADALLFYQRELRFYQELAPTVPLRTAKLHAGIMAEDSTDFVIVMEDLSGLRGLDQARGVSVDDAILAVESLAGFHAHHWGQDLGHLADTFLPVDNPVYRAALPGIFSAGWPEAKAQAADLLTPEVVAFGDRFAELVPFFLEGVDSADTVIHGDWRADNLMVDEAGRLAVVDFQITGIGTATYDLGYFMSQSLEPEVRRPANDRIIEAYYSALAATGVDFDRTALDRVFKLATAWCLIYPIANFPDFEQLPENTQAMARAMLRRSVTSIMDQDALSLLP